MFATSRESVQVASGKLQTSWPTPPPHTEVARVARYVVHISGMTIFIHRCICQVRLDRLYCFDNGAMPFFLLFTATIKPWNVIFFSCITTVQ